MCRLAFLEFARGSRQRDRASILELAAWRGWDLGNQSGLGWVSYEAGEEVGEPRRYLDFLEASLALRSGKVRLGTRVLLHSRLSTNVVDLAHTHPFTEDGAALIHNGIVSLADGVEAPEMVTQNDSEILLRLYLAGGHLLERALEQCTGQANVILGDVLTGELGLYPDDKPFLGYEGSGALVGAIIQEPAQLAGLRGLKKVFELANGYTYRLGLGGRWEEPGRVTQVKRPEVPWCVVKDWQGGFYYGPDKWRGAPDDNDYKWQQLLGERE